VPHRPRARTLEAINDPASLGYVYGAVTEHLGWRRGDEEGTVMALAALGDPARFRHLFARGPSAPRPRASTSTPATSPHASSPRDTRGHRGASSPRPAPSGTRSEPLQEVHQDLAAALQERTEQVMVHLARRARAAHRLRRLCVGGGVATNCVSIGKIVEAGIFDEVFVPPAPGDAGTAIGAALAVHTDSGKPEARCRRGRPRLLPRPVLPGAEDLDLTSLARAPPEDPGHRVAEFLADQLAHGMIAGLFQGRVEAGPRALGNRSILASPLQPGVVERLNATVKFREPFRPFAPVVLAERAATTSPSARPAPYMSIASGP
jgi:carbamoyltransferase